MFYVIDVMKYIIIVWWPDWDGNVRMTWTRGVECFNEIFGNNLFVICLLLKFDLQQSLAGDQWCWVSKTCAAQPGPATDWCKLVFKTDCSHSQYWLHCLHRRLQCHPSLHSIFESIDMPTYLIYNLSIEIELWIGRWRGRQIDRLIDWLLGSSVDRKSDKLIDGRNCSAIRLLIHRSIVR